MDIIWEKLAAGFPDTTQLVVRPCGSSWRC